VSTQQVNLYKMFNKKLLILLFFLAVVYILIVLGISAQQGKLSTVPLYDDCTYFRDAGKFLYEIKDKNNFLSAFKNTHIHSPYCFLISLVALFFSNYETSIIYFSNLIPVFLGLLGCLFCISKLSFFQISLLLIWALSTPIFIIAGAEFRPDPLWGFLLA
jgi:hypothetical protein